MGFLDVEVAHRIPSKPPQTGRDPRAIIVTFSKTDTRNRVFEIANGAWEKMFEGSLLQIFQDQTRHIQKLRLGFWQPKQILRENKMGYSMIREVTLRVIHQDKVHLFETPEEAMRCVETLEGH